MQSFEFQIARTSLAFLWLFSAITSSFWAYSTSQQILADINISSSFADIMIYGGSLLDLVLGIWILSGWRFRTCCYSQIVIITIYSVLLTFIAPSFWLHPFGPITKNIPVMVLVWLLAKQSNKQNNNRF